MKLAPIIRSAFLYGVGPICASIALQAQAVKAPPRDASLQAEAQLQKGISLTSDGHFSQAIPYLKAARGHVKENYAASFDLALCDVGIGEFKPAIEILKELQEAKNDTEAVNNLLAQAYIGAGQFDQGWSFFEKAAAMSPNDEKLYLFVTDAFTAQQNYALGLDVANLGLKRLPASARLYYERGMLLTLRGESDLGRKNLQMAAALAPGSTVAYLANAQRESLGGDIDATIHVAREGIQKGHDDYRLLAILGEALIRSGALPGQRGFAEAQSALEQSVAQKPNYSSSQIALGKLYLMENRLDDAISHLEIGKSLSPNNTSAYPSLAVAYRRKGEIHRAEATLATLEKLNQEQAAKIGAPSGGRRSSYGSAVIESTENPNKGPGH